MVRPFRIGCTDRDAADGCGTHPDRPASRDTGDTGRSAREYTGRRICESPGDTAAKLALSDGGSARSGAA